MTRTVPLQPAPPAEPARDPHPAQLVTLDRVDHPQLPGSPRVADHELTVVPGATAAELAARLLAVPAGAVFTEHYGDVDLTVVFRQLPPPPG